MIISLRQYQEMAELAEHKTGVPPDCYRYTGVPGTRAENYYEEFEWDGKLYRRYPARASISGLEFDYVGSTFKARAWEEEL